MAVLHDFPLQPGEWWACSEPERPYDGDQVYDEGCRLCLIKAEVDLRIFGDRPMLDVTGGEQTGHMLSDLAAGRVPSD